MAMACNNGHVGCVQLLSSYGASRKFDIAGALRFATAERIAAQRPQ